jgi:hypothetical protein
MKMPWQKDYDWLDGRINRVWQEVSHKANRDSLDSVCRFAAGKGYVDQKVGMLQDQIADLAELALVQSALLQSLCERLPEPKKAARKK